MASASFISLDRHAGAEHQRLPVGHGGDGAVRGDRTDWTTPETEPSPEVSVRPMTASAWFMDESVIMDSSFWLTLIDCSTLEKAASWLSCWWRPSGSAILVLHLGDQELQEGVVVELACLASALEAVMSRRCWNST